MTTRLVKTNGTALLIGTIDGKERAITLEEVLEVMAMWFFTASSESELPQRANDLLRDYLETIVTDTKSESF